MGLFLYGLGFFGLLLCVIGLLKYLQFRRKHNAALNVVLGKYTHQQLNKKQQQQVHDKAVAMVLASNSKMRGFADDVERYGWYALAMKDLGIASLVPENPCWTKVKNPYMDIRFGDRLIQVLADSLKQQYGIHLNFRKYEKEE